MSEQTEDIDLLSQKELEDGEIEEGELDEPASVGAIDNESEIINIDNLNDSDVNINDKSKIKKHKHHKKGLHRKRHINSEEKIDSKWKKSKKSNDEDDDDLSPDVNDNKNVSDSESFPNDVPRNDGFKSVSKEIEGDKIKPIARWGSYDSDEDTNKCNSFNKVEAKQNLIYTDNNNKINQKEVILSPVYETTQVELDSTAPGEIIVTTKWAYDSDEEFSTANNTSSNRNSFNDNKRWDSNKNNSGGWNDNRKHNSGGWVDNLQSKVSPIQVVSPVKNTDNIIDSPSVNKGGWGSYESPTNVNDSNKISLECNPQKSNVDNFGKWGSFDSPEKSCEGNPKWGARNSPKRNDDSNPWGNNNESPKRNEDDNQRWGNRDSPKRNDDGDQRLGSRDGSRRNNFRRRDGSRRGGFRRRNEGGGNQRWNNSSNDNNQRWNNSNNDNNQRWSNSNNVSPQRSNDDNKRWGSSNNGSPQRNNEDNKRWGSKDGSPPRNDNKRWGSNNGSPQRTSDGSKRWGLLNNNSPQRNDNKKWDSNNVSPVRGDDKKSWGSLNNDSPRAGETNKTGLDSYDVPQTAKWSYDSDDGDSKPTTKTNSVNIELKVSKETTNWGSFSPEVNKIDNSNKWESRTSPKANIDTIESSSGAAKWSYDSDEESKPVANSNCVAIETNKSAWKLCDSDNETKDTPSSSFSDKRNRGGYNNSNWNRNDSRNDRNDSWNDRNESRNDRGGGNKRWTNRNDGEKRNVCKYFSMGSCRHGDRCSFLHESPTKSVPPESKKKELCKFYEHQQCYKRANCIFMHEEFPCKLFHAGTKMCPSGDSCKYSHSPLTQETKIILEKYLDEKVDERTDKNNSSDWSSIIKKSAEDDADDDNTPGFEQPEIFFPDTMRYRFPASQDMMRFPPVRPWNTMMRYNESIPMQVPHQMEFMHRQRFMCQYPMNTPTGRMIPRGFRGMVPPNIHEGFSNGLPFSIPPLMPGNPKMMPSTPGELNISDPYIDNLAQLVVGKDLAPSPKRLVDMLDPNMQGEDIDDFSLEISTNSSKKNLASPVMLKSPEIPPGAYVPRTSMNVAQPNVRLGPGPAYGSEQPMLYGGYPGHPSETAMMDYINMSAIHYFHNHNESMAYDIPWKLILLEVPIKIPYPLMVIDTQDMMHKYTDPRLRGHPSVLHSNSTNDESFLHQNSYDFNSISNYGSQLSSSSSISPHFTTANHSSEYSETLTPLNDFIPKIDEPESPLFPIDCGELFNFKSKLETDDYSKRISDRSYLQDPRFKRKKVVVNIASEPSEIE